MFSIYKLCENSSTVHSPDIIFPTTIKSSDKYAAEEFEEDLPSEYSKPPTAIAPRENHQRPPHATKRKKTKS